MKASIQLSAIVGRLLRSAGMVSGRNKIYLDSLASNPERRDSGERRQFLVTVNESPIAFATVGPDLSALRDRTVLFAKTYPELGCSPVGFGHYARNDLLLTEYFPGSRLDKCHLNSEKIIEILRGLESRFLSALEPSDRDALQHELQHLFLQAEKLPFWTRADRGFLRHALFPIVEEHLLTGRIQQRVTNGDFVPHNIIVGDDGSVRIIDYEFTASTHFFEEDWLRFTYWSTLPDEVREFALSHLVRPTGTYLYLALKQLVTESQVNLPQKAQIDAQSWCAGIRRTILHKTKELRHSLIFPVPPDELEGDYQVRAEIFWMTDEGWSPQRSLSLLVPYDRRFCLKFHIPPGPSCHGLRFDPSECPGHVTIHSLRVQTSQPGDKFGTLAFHASDPSGLSQLQPAGDALILSNIHSNRFEVICTGQDPQLYLIGVGAKAGHQINVEIELTFSNASGAQLLALRQHTHALNQQLASAIQQAKSATNQLAEAYNHSNAKVQDQQKLFTKLEELFSGLHQSMVSATRVDLSDAIDVRLGRFYNQFLEGLESHRTALDSALKRIAEDEHSMLKTSLNDLQQALRDIDTLSRQNWTHVAEALTKIENGFAVSHRDLVDRQELFAKNLMAGFTESTGRLQELDEKTARNGKLLELNRDSQETQLARIEALLGELSAHRIERDRLVERSLILTEQVAIAVARASSAEEEAKQLREMVSYHGRTIDRLERLREYELVFAKELQAEIIKLTQVADERLSAIHHLEDQLGRLAQELAAVRQSAVEKDRMLADCAGREARLVSETKGLTSETAQLSAKLSELEVRLEILRQSGADLSAQLEMEKASRMKIIRSATWRWTAPLRTLHAYFFSRKT